MRASSDDEETEAILNIRTKNVWWTMEKTINILGIIKIINKFHKHIYIYGIYNIYMVQIYSHHNRCTLLAFLTVFSINYSHPKLRLAA